MSGIYRLLFLNTFRLIKLVEKKYTGWNWNILCKNIHFLLVGFVQYWKSVKDHCNVKCTSFLYVSSDPIAWYRFSCGRRRFTSPLVNQRSILPKHTYFLQHPQIHFIIESLSPRNSLNFPHDCFVFSLFLSTLLTSRLRFYITSASLWSLTRKQTTFWNNWDEEASAVNSMLNESFVPPFAIKSL